MLKKVKRKNLPSLETLPARGVYTLVTRLNREVRLKVGGLGSFNFKKGYYAYSGSAVGNGAVSLPLRVMRHLNKEKVRHWHIDFFLANKNVKIIAVIAAETNMNEECRINKAVMNIDRATIPIAGFGASDCRQNCGSHLVHIAEGKVIARITEAYTNLFGNACKTYFLEG